MLFYKSTVAAAQRGFFVEKGRKTMVKGKRVQYRRRRSPYRRPLLLLILLCVIVGVIIFAVSRFTSGSDGEQVDPDSSAIHDDQSEEEPSQRADGEMPEADSGQADGDAAGAAPETPPAEEAEAGYVFGSPLPESEAVDDSWFSDAVFLGTPGPRGSSSTAELPLAPFSGSGACPSLRSTTPATGKSL